MLSYSIAQTRNKFTSIVHDVENLSSIEITRWGKPIAMLISIAEYQRLKAGKQNFGESYRQFRASTNWDDLDIGPEVFADVRDRSTGREENPWLDSY